MQLLHEGDYGPMQAFFPGGSPLRRLIVPSRVVHPWFPNRARAVAHRILVVDDEPMVRALIARALIDDGFEVVAVANGLAALRQDFPSLPILHVDDVSRRSRVAPLPSDVPTIYKPFSIAALRAAVRGLLAR